MGRVSIEVSYSSEFYGTFNKELETKMHKSFSLRSSNS